MSHANNSLIILKKNYDSQVKRNKHLLMNQLYYRLLYGDSEEQALSESEKNHLHYLEEQWMADEKNHCLNQYDCDLPVTGTSCVEAALQAHSVFHHPLFAYLQHEANLADLSNFIRSESILNLEFFDYLALAIVGVSDQAKAEIITNLWDEAGQSDINKFHTTLFLRLMNALAIPYERNQLLESLSWEGIAGINLFSYLSLHQFNKMKYFGLLAATEMLDPPHYHQLIKGITRLFAHHKLDATYYIEHETIDVHHANGWLNKVVIPELHKRPNKTRDFWLGFYLRLDSAARYYDQLLAMFKTKQAA